MSFSNLFRRKPVALIQKDAELGYGDHGELERGHPHLRQALGVVDLTALGIAAVIGAGIFSTIGSAAFSGGPAVAFLFVFTAVACAFSALCYAEFASRIPVAGSAYTYAYASFGELMRSEEHTSELQSRQYLVCRLLLEKKKKITYHASTTTSLHVDV